MALNVFPPHMAKPSKDTIFLRNLSISACVGGDAWHRIGRAQPVIIDLSMSTSLRAAGRSDDISDSVSYSDIAKKIRSIATSLCGLEDANGSYWSSSQALATAIGRGISQLFKKSRSESAVQAQLVITLPKALLLAEGGMGAMWTAELQEPGRDIFSDYARVYFKAIKIPCIIGVNPHERLEKQYVVVDLTFWEVQQFSQLWQNYHIVIPRIVEVRKGCEKHLALWFWLTRTQGDREVIFPDARSACLIHRADCLRIVEGGVRFINSLCSKAQCNHRRRWVGCGDHPRTFGFLIDRSGGVVAAAQTKRRFAICPGAETSMV